MPSAAVLSCVVLAAVARADAPRSPTPVRIAWDAPSGCSDPDVFFANVQARTERVRRAEPGEQAVRVELRISPAGAGRVHGEVRTLDGEGRSELRKVDGATCEEVADALSLTLALALGFTPGATATSPAGSPTPPVASPWISTAPTPGTPSAPTAPARVEPSPPSVPTAAATEPPPPSPPRPPPPPPPAGPGTPTAPRTRPPPEASTLALGLGLVAGEVSAPTFDLGPTVLVRLGLGGGASPDWSLSLAAMHLRNDLVGGAPDVAITLSALALTVCPGWGIDVHLVFEVCGTTTAGWVYASDRAVQVQTAVQRSWWSAGPVLRARLDVGWGLVVFVDAAAHIPLVRRHFVTTTPEETVARTPVVAGMLGFVIAREL